MYCGQMSPNLNFLTAKESVCEEKGKKNKNKSKYAVVTKK